MFLQSLSIFAALILSVATQSDYDLAPLSTRFHVKEQICTPTDHERPQYGAVDLGPLEFTQFGLRKRGAGPPTFQNRGAPSLPATTTAQTINVTGEWDPTCITLAEVSFSESNVAPIANSKTVTLDPNYGQFNYWIAVSIPIRYNITLWQQKSDTNFAVIASADAPTPHDGVWTGGFRFDKKTDIHFQIGFPELEGPSGANKVVSGGIGLYLSSTSEDAGNGLCEGFRCTAPGSASTIANDQSYPNNGDR